MLGFPGSGKSYWGARLAALLDRPFLDLDRHIESQTGWPIAGLFDTLGEPGFRAVERAALLTVPARSGLLVACGGGTPCFFDNLDRMQRAGRTVFLDVPVELLTPRLWRDRATRPLLRDVPEAEFAPWVAGRLQARRPWYERAECRIACTGDERAIEAALLRCIGA